ncbi:endonuclease 8-like 3 [Grus japonensis]|uniref:Endonuclease 8-like 3 n=1 Tax=Grus japonensis TaxID=30415 RepID=A0ABC9WT40_GRUJA
MAKALAAPDNYIVEESSCYDECKGLPDTKVTAASEERASGHDFLIGHVYRGVETLGKELFMYFDQKALRIHFGMNGSMHINPDGSKDRNGALPMLEIQLTEDTVCFYEVTVEYRNAAESEQKVRTMESLDVCSPKFSFSRAESQIKQQKIRMLCDVLLDQAVLPGVGNIIKNEALFDSGLHPAVKVCQLTDEHIRHLVKMTRDFTLLFYKCRKIGSPLYKHCKVYKRPACGQCNGKITVCRLGENNRMTYFCSQCQKVDPQLVNISKLPTRNSLIGWAYGRGSCSNEHVAQKSEEEWTCMRCTLINKPSAEICDACLTSRPEGNSTPQANMTDDIRMLSVGHPRCSKHSRLCSLRVVRKDGENKGRQFYTCPLPRETQCDYFQWADLSFPFCNHGKRCVMKTVLKIGPNNGKNFFVCPLGKEKQCGFFQWAENGPGMQVIP